MMRVRMLALCWLAAPQSVGAFGVSALAPSSLKLQRVPTRREAKRKRSAKRASAPEVAELPADAARPRLVVFDLDNTVWNPELYQLGRRPKAGKDIDLCDGARDALFDLATNAAWRGSAAAVASRTHRAELAEELLTEFQAAPGVSLATVLPHREIFTGSKRKHFQNLRDKTGVPFHDMLFFDDWTQNLGDVANLGVLGIHTPRGLTRDLWRGGLLAYARLKAQDTAFMGRMFTPADIAQL